MAEYTILLSTELKARPAEQGIDRLQRKIDKLKNTFRTAFGGAGAGGVRGGTRGGARTGRATTGVTGGGAFAIRGIATEVGAAVQGLTIALGALAGAMILVSRQAVNMSAEFEVLAITFETLIGNVEIADELIQDLKEFAVKTPLQLRDIEQAATVLLGLGEAAEDVVPILTTLGQAASALNKPLEQFIRVRNLLSQGVILTRALTPLGVSREQLGDILDIKDLAEASGEELVQAFDTALGRFAGLFQRTFDTVRGRLSNLKDVFDVTFAAIGDPAREIIIETVDQITAAFDRVREFFEKNKEAVQDALKIIRDSIKNFLGPAIAAVEQFFSALEDKPELLNNVARGIVLFTNSLIGLVVVGTIATSILNLLAGITLFRIALPQLTATVVALKGSFAALGPAITKGVGSLKIFGQAALAGGAAGTIARGAILNMVKAFGRFTIIAGVAIQAIINWKSTLTLLGSAVRLLTDALDLLLIPFDFLASLLPGITDFSDLLSRAFDLIANSVEVLLRGLSLLIELTKFQIGADNDLIGATQRLNDTIVRWKDNQGIALSATERYSLALAEAKAESDRLNASMDSFSSDNMVDEINAVTDAALALNSQLKTLAGPGPALSLDPRNFLLSDQERQLLRDFDPAAVGEAVGSAVERLNLEELTDRLREVFGTELFPAPGGAGGGAADPRTKTKADVLAAQQAVIDRFAEENIARKDKLALWISIQDAAALAFKEKAIVFNEFQQEAIDQLAQRNMERKDKFDLARRLDLEELQAQKDKNARFQAAEELRLEQADRIAKDFLEGLSRIFDQFVRSFGDITKVAGKGANQLLGLGGQALGASFFGKAGAGAGFAKGGLFAEGALLGGLGPGLIAAAATGLAGLAINTFFGKEKAIEIEGPVDVNIIDIAVSALKIFNFRGFEGFTFTSRYRTVFQSGSY